MLLARRLNMKLEQEESLWGILFNCCSFGSESTLGTRPMMLEFRLVCCMMLRNCFSLKYLSTCHVGFRNESLLSKKDNFSVDTVSSSALAGLLLKWLLTFSNATIGFNAVKGLGWRRQKTFCSLSNWRLILFHATNVP